MATSMKMQSDKTSDDSPKQEDGRLLTYAAPKALIDHIQSYGLQDRQLSDITLTYKGKDYFLHKIILSQSQYFRALFSSPWKENNENRVELRLENPDVTPQVFEMVVSYLYGSVPAFSVENLASVYALGSFLGLLALCKDAEKFPLKDINLGNFEGYYVLSQDVSCAGQLADAVTDACMKLLYSHASRELNYFLPNLTLKILINLLKADELWIPTESDRYKFAKQCLRDWKLAHKGCSQATFNPHKRLKTCDATAMESCDEDCNKHKTFDTSKSNVNGGDTELKNLRMLWEEDREYQEDNFEEVFDTLFTYGGIIFAHMELDEILRVKMELKNADLSQDIADNSLWQNALFYKSKTARPDDSDRFRSHRFDIDRSDSDRFGSDRSDSDRSDSLEYFSDDEVGIVDDMAAIYGPPIDEENNSTKGGSNKGESDVPLMISQNISSTDQDPELRKTSAGFTWLAKLDIGNPLSGFPPIRFSAEYLKKDTVFRNCGREDFAYAGYVLGFSVQKNWNTGRIHVNLQLRKVGTMSRKVKHVTYLYVHTSSGMCSIDGGVRVSTLNRFCQTIPGAEAVDVLEDKPLRVSAVLQLIE